MCIISDYRSSYEQFFGKTAPSIRRDASRWFVYFVEGRRQRKSKTDIATLTAATNELAELAEEMALVQSV